MQPGMQSKVAPDSPFTRDAALLPVVFFLFGLFCLSKIRTAHREYVYCQLRQELSTSWCAIIDTSPFNSTYHDDPNLDDHDDHDDPDDSGTTQEPLCDHSGATQGPLWEHSGATQGPLQDHPGIGAYIQSFSSNFLVRHGNFSSGPWRASFWLFCC